MAGNQKKVEKNSDSTSERQNVDRREFLKKAGLGAIGFGAILSPVSADSFKIKDDGFEVHTGTGPDELEKYFSINQSGLVDVPNSSLKVKGSNLQKSFAATLSSHLLNEEEFTALDRFTIPSNGHLRIYVAGITNDEYNTPSGLNLIVRNQSTDTNEKIYNSNHIQGEPLDKITESGGDNIALVADNGNFGSGTDEPQVVTARVKYEIIESD